MKRADAGRRPQIGNRRPAPVAQPLRRRDGRRIKILNDDEPSAYDGQVMLLPWFDSPRRPPAGVVHLRPGKLPPPDPVVIPNDEEDVS